MQARGCLFESFPSVTQRYTFTNRAVVVTADHSAENLEALHKDHWLANPANVVLMELGTSKAWVEEAVLGGLGPQGPGSPREGRPRRPRVGPGPHSPALWG